MDAEAVEKLEERLTQIVRLIVDSPDAAKHGLLVTTEAHRLSISDLHVIVANGDRQSRLHALTLENRQLRADVFRLRGAKGFSWADFVAACGEKVDTSRAKWRGIVASHLDLTVGDLTSFERANRVPVAVLKQLETLPDQRDVMPKGSRMSAYLPSVVQKLRRSGLDLKQIRHLLLGLLQSYDGNEASVTQAISQTWEQTETEHKARANARTWNRDEYLSALDVLRQKKGGLPALYAAIPTATEGQINRKFNNDPPDEGFLGPIIIADSGPMTYVELWKIAHALYGETWKKDITQRFGWPRNTIQWDEPSYLTEEQCAALRHDWHERPRPRHYEVFEHLALLMSNETERTTRISWWPVIYKMRDQGVELPNDVGPQFAARFNREHFELFDIKRKTREAYQHQLNIEGTDGSRGD